jgi:hypothetical protein
MTNLKLQIPLIKNYTNDADEYHLAFSISTTEQDAYGFIMSEKAMKSMLNQAKDITINASHRDDLNNIIGPVTDAWLEKKDNINRLWVDVNVQQAWMERIKGLVNSGVRLGGSIEFKLTDVSYTKDGTMIIEDLQLHGAALTTIPANKATLGTATGVEGGCPGSLCMQLSKQLNKKLEANKLPKIEEKTDENVKNSVNAIETLSEKVDNLLGKLTSKTSSEVSEVSEDDEKSKLEKEILELKTENTKLKNNIMQKEQDTLVNKALNLNKKLNPNTKIINKETLLEEVKSLSNNDNDVYLQLESYNKGLELALKTIPEGDVPHVSNSALDKSEIKLQEKVLETTRKINGIGKED